MKEQLLICTDMDRTLIPNGTQAESGHAREMFAELAAQPWITIAYVTGRDRPLVQHAIETYRLPLPDFLISDVGSNIYAVVDGNWSLWTQWTEHIAPDFNGLDGGQMRGLLADMPGLRPQEYAKQKNHKVSFYVPLHVPREQLDGRLRDRLSAHGVRANLIWSIDEPAGVGLLDILPQSASKLHAIEHVQQVLQLGAAQVVFAGDSGNDMNVLTSHIPAVLVANAPDTVRTIALQASAAQGNSNLLYLARGGFLAMNGNYSAGILEGIAHFHPAVGRWLQQLHASRPQS